MTITALKSRTNRINQTPLRGLPNVPVCDQTPLERILALGWDHDMDTDCWLSRLRKNADGYAVLSLSGHGLHEVGAHRVSYELWRGPIPEGLYILHSCDRTACINPAHLSCGTAAENSAQMVARRRHPRHGVTHCDQGHLLPDAGRRVNGRCRICRIHREVRAAAGDRWLALAAA